MHNLYRRRKLSEKPTQKRTNPWPEYTQKLNLQVALTKVKCLKCQFLNIITVAKLLFITTPTFNTPRFLKKLNPLFSLRSRRLEVVGTRKNGGARRRHPSSAPSRVPVLSFTHYFQAPARQAALYSCYTVEPLHNGHLGDRRK